MSKSNATSIEINVNQGIKDEGIQIESNGKDVLGIVFATISHKEKNIVTWGFTLKLDFAGELINNNDGSPSLALSLLDVTRAYLWREHITKNGDGDFVKYTLSDEERDDISRLLEEAVMSHVANSGVYTVLTNPPIPKHGDVKTANNSVSDGDYTTNANPEHMSLDFYSNGAFINRNLFSDSFEGIAHGVLHEHINFLVDFECEYKETYKQAEYIGGVLIKPMIRSISDFKMKSFACVDFGDLNTSKSLPDYKLSVYDEEVVKHIIYYEMKKRFTQDAFPIGENDQLSLVA